MHHAFEIQEVLTNIFSHFEDTPSLRNEPIHTFGSELVALAGTCRMFKEPALDILWSVLHDLSPLARCLPDVSYRPSLRHVTYFFYRLLTQDEWNTLQSYTRRVRSIMRFDQGLHWDSVTTCLTPQSPASNVILFPNLRNLECVLISQKVHFPLHQHFPSLVSLDISFLFLESLWDLQECLALLPGLSPNVKELFIRVPPPQDISDENTFKYVSHWSNLESLYCPEITLELDVFIHLSRMPALTQLVFTPGDSLPDKIVTSDSPILFANLRHLKLFNSASLESMARLLARVRLPVVTDLVVRTRACPAKSVERFIDAVRSFIPHTLSHLAFGQDRISADISGWESEPILNLDDLRPITSLTNLRVVDINVKWNVSFVDSELLELVSAWPFLEHFHINPDWGWTTSSGITVDGLLQLLQSRRSLSHISVAVDARGYTQAPPGRLPSSLGLKLPATFHLNVINSVLEAESVTAMVALLVDIASLTADFDFCVWSSWGIERHAPELQDVYGDRWTDVYVRANDAIQKCSRSESTATRMPNLIRNSRADYFG